MNLGVAAFECYWNCPVHDAGSFCGQSIILDIKHLKRIIIEHINSRHVIDVLSFTKDTYMVKYLESSHSYVGAELYVNGYKIYYTADNGSGKLRWIQDAI